MTAHDHTFRILALDGGGSRGIYAAQMLACIEQALGAPIRKGFDLVAGTSTGSILAGAAAADIPMAKVVDIYQGEAARVFRKRWSGLSLFRSRYSREPLEQMIQHCVSNVTLGEITTPLMIMASDISSGRVHVFKSLYLEETGGHYVRDAEVSLSDAILASCSAPTYFDPKPVGDFLLADGGLWANNPSIMALTEALSRFAQPLEQVRILSIGAGHSLTFYSKKQRWGLATGWQREKLVGYMLGLQSQASTNMASLLLGERYMRLDPQIGNWPLDDIHHLGNLRAQALQDFAKCRSSIMAMIERPHGLAASTAKPCAEKSEYERG